MIQLRFSPQLFRYPAAGPEGPPEPIASGVLLRADHAYFLITAKHVFNYAEVSDIILMLRPRTMIRLKGEVKYLEPDRE